MHFARRGGERTREQKTLSAKCTRAEAAFRSARAAIAVRPFSLSFVRSLARARREGEIGQGSGRDYIYIYIGSSVARLSRRSRFARVTPRAIERGIEIGIECVYVSRVRDG